MCILTTVWSHPLLWWKKISLLNFPQTWKWISLSERDFILFQSWLWTSEPTPGIGISVLASWAPSMSFIYRQLDPSHGDSDPFPCPGDLSRCLAQFTEDPKARGWGSGSRWVICDWVQVLNCMTSLNFSAFIYKTVRSPGSDTGHIPAHGLAPGSPYISSNHCNDHRRENDGFFIQRELTKSLMFWAPH